jgi:hypothetical protein
MDDKNQIYYMLHTEDNETLYYHPSFNLLLIDGKSNGKDDIVEDNDYKYNDEVDTYTYKNNSNSVFVNLKKLLTEQNKKANGIKKQFIDFKNKLIDKKKYNWEHILIFTLLTNIIFGYKQNTEIVEYNNCYKKLTISILNIGDYIYYIKDYKGEQNIDIVDDINHNLFDAIENKMVAVYDKLHSNGKNKKNETVEIENNTGKKIKDPDESVLSSDTTKLKASTTNSNTQHTDISDGTNEQNSSKDDYVGGSLHPLKKYKLIKK